MSASQSSAARRAAAAVAVALIATIAWLVQAPATSATPGGNNSAATITGEFADSCTDFSAHSSKDISHVEIHYVDGRVVKDETINSPDHSIDGAEGDEIDFTIVKSGTTSETFTCTSANSPPTAVLEVETPPGCVTSDEGLVGCDGTLARTGWTHSIVPELGYGYVQFLCGWPDDQSCVDHVMPCGQKDFYSLCEVTYTYRGTASTDPDNDIVYWTLDFGDGTSTGGDWATNPPTEVPHVYLRHHCPLCEPQPATLTVTDSASQSDSDAQLAVHTYPD